MAYEFTEQDREELAVAYERVLARTEEFMATSAREEPFTLSGRKFRQCSRCRAFVSADLGAIEAHEGVHHLEVMTFRLLAATALKVYGKVT